MNVKVFTFTALKNICKQQEEVGFFYKKLYTTDKRKIHHSLHFNASFTTPLQL